MQPVATTKKVTYQAMENNQAETDNPCPSSRSINHATNMEAEQARSSPSSFLIHHRQRFCTKLRRTPCICPKRKYSFPTYTFYRFDTSSCNLPWKLDLGPIHSLFPCRPIGNTCCAMACYQSTSRHHGICLGPDTWTCRPQPAWDRICMLQSSPWSRRWSSLERQWLVHRRGR